MHNHVFLFNVIFKVVFQLHSLVSTDLEMKSQQSTDQLSDIVGAHTHLLVLSTTRVTIPSVYRGGWTLFMKQHPGIV
jgi:hypothetical protein